MGDSGVGRNPVSDLSCLASLLATAASLASIRNLDATTNGAQSSCAVELPTSASLAAQMIVGVIQRGCLHNFGLG